MTDSPSQGSSRGSSRRTFLATSSAAAAAAALPAALTAAAKPRRPDVLRVGLIGCGGRGTGAAKQALNADPGARLVAMGDVFEDHLETSLRNLAEDKRIADRLDVPADRRFTDFDNYAKVLEQDLDVVILATSPHFRPLHLRAAIDKGVHVFAEKPVAVDAPGVRSILESCKLATQKGLSVVSGLCYRYHDSRRALMERIHSGQIGDVVSMNANYITGELWHHERRENWSEMEYQMRNWLYFTWLSGDMIAEQHIHSLDVMAWAMKDAYPTSAVSMGGRQKRTDAKFGHIYDHFATIYEWDNGTKGYSFCRQQDGCYREVSDHIVGTKGRADIFKGVIKGETDYRFKAERRSNMYQNEHDELFAAVRAGKPINNGEYMSHSTLMAIMGRMAAYTGQKITWDQALHSQENLTPEGYGWGDVANAKIAIPGLTKFV